MTRDDRNTIIDSAAIGAITGAFISGYPAMSQGGGGGNGGNSLGWVGAGLLLGGAAGAALGYLANTRWPGWRQTSEACAGYSLINPCAGQFDLQVSGMFGFTGPGSIVRVREFQTEGTGLHFGDMGMDSQQMPTLDVRYWFTRLSAIHFRFRYFNMGGSSYSSTPIKFNGTIIPGGRTNNFGPWEWFAVGLYYERRLTPLYQDYESNLPVFLQGWDLRARLGIEYTYLNFVINGGTTPVASSLTSQPHGEETKEDFYHQAMPLPTIGLEAYRRIANNFLFAGSVEGNWINRWNSLRSEGGTVWASQNGVEAHLRVYYTNRAWFGPVKPMAGFFYYYYSQLEDSHEDGNFIRWMSYGPEVGISWSF